MHFLIALGLYAALLGAMRYRGTELSLAFLRILLIPVLIPGVAMLYLCRGPYPYAALAIGHGLCWLMRTDRM